MSITLQVMDRQAESLSRRTERALRDELERIESVEREAGVPLDFQQKMDIQRRLQLIELKAAKQERERADRARLKDATPPAAACSHRPPSPAHDGQQSAGARRASHLRCVCVCGCVCVCVCVGARDSS